MFSANRAQVLASPRFAYLVEKLAECRCPIAFRLSYALQIVEHIILEDVKADVVDIPDAEVVTYMFDGAVVKGPGWRRRPRDRSCGAGRAEVGRVLQGHPRSHLPCPTRLGIRPLGE